MKLSAIGIFKKNGEQLALRYADNTIAKQVANYISQQIIPKLKNENIPRDASYAINVEKYFFYIHSNGYLIFIIASPNKIDTNNSDVLDDCFEDLKKLSPTRYALLDKKIENPTCIVSSQKWAEKQVEEARKAALETMEQVLSRGEHIELLVTKTKVLAESSINFNGMKDQVKAKKSSTSIADKFYCFFCCGRKRPKKTQNEWELSEPLLSNYDDRTRGRNFRQ